ncbi:MAG: hypothetical protein MR009_01715 [Sutterellaceae bacterium]|nr:hypothetical protein [Sutterellaceae bacterium]MDD7441148.1 hypothetical protein [Sutterellaceae bacterium]MDY2868217.1 hypothetical protein [Mesosutterella sp.]
MNEKEMVAELNRELAPVPGIRTAGFPGAFVMKADRGTVIGSAASCPEGEGKAGQAFIVPPEKEARSVLVGQGTKGKGASMRSHRLLVLSGPGRAPDPEQVKRAGDAAASGTWLASARAFSGQEGCGSSSASFKCFIEFVETSISVTVFRAGKGTAAIAATSAKLSPSGAAEAARLLLRETSAQAAVIAATGQAGSAPVDPEGDTGWESFRAALLSTALKARGTEAGERR